MLLLGVPLICAIIKTTYEYAIIRIVVSAIVEIFWKRYFIESCFGIIKVIDDLFVLCHLRQGCALKGRHVSSQMKSAVGGWYVR